MSRHKQHEPAGQILAAQAAQAAYDLKQLFHLRATLDSLHDSDPPQVCLVSAAPTGRLRRVGIVCGSFNPLTRAHAELAEQVCQAWNLDCVFFSLAKVTVDKEYVTGMSLEDRLLLLCVYAERHARMSVAVVNRGLYVEQAQAFRNLFGPDTQLFFVTGMDKLVQILDPRYYQDRDAALRELFDLASLIVANRGAFTQAEFTQLLGQAENQPFRSAIHFFSLFGGSQNLKDMSATAIRDALTMGQPIDDLVPEEAGQFLAATQVYRPVYVPALPDKSEDNDEAEADKPLDAYALRLALMQLLYTVRSWAEREADFQRLLQLAVAPSQEGRSLRAMALRAARTDHTQLAEPEPVAGSKVVQEDLIHRLRRYQLAAEKPRSQDEQ